MRNTELLPIVMAGGSGTRLWPLSRELHPKQFLTLPGQDLSMLQMTLARVEGLSDMRPLVISNESHRFLVAEQLRQVGKLEHNILLEPVGRNTAPAIALAALHAQRDGNDPLMLVLAADHMIGDVPAFHAAVQAALPLANAGLLVTFGIVPSIPETGYGYIHRGKPLSKHAFEVASFVEKPDLATAEKYLTTGEYYWNSGMFLFRASVYLRELAAYRPDILAACEKSIASSQPDLDFIRIDKDAFTACPSDSIDYAVMEKTLHAAVVPLSANWSDVGAFSSLWEVCDKDSDGNAFHGEVLAINTANTLILAENCMVATIGVKDLVVVQTKDALLVADLKQAQDVKQIVQQLKASNRSEAQLHRQVYRPWGHYDSIDSGTRHQVKRITVNPGAKLSVQMHHHRAEHWVVVSGTALVTLDGKEKLLTENQSIYLPIGAVHALENPGKIPLELIEVQVGPYLGEDDIVRFSDKYGRC